MPILWKKKKKPEKDESIPTLETGRLFLRPWNIEEDAPALLAILQEKDVLRYMPPSPTPPELERVQGYINRQLAQWHTRGYGHWAVVSREAEELLGWAGLGYVSEVGEIEVAYLLRPVAWGKGLATEAAQAAVRYGFEKMGLDKIIGLVHPDNIASVRVLQKCGLTYVKHVALWGMELDWYRAFSPAS